jgi:hypothetical protein
MPVCIPPTPWRGLALNRAGYFLGLALTRIAAHEPLGTALCGGFSSLRPSAPGGGGAPGWVEDGTGRYSIRIFNSNAVLDDSWDIYVNGVYAFNYDGGTQTSFTWTADLPPGAYSFEARFAAEQNDNFFSWEVADNGTVIASGDSGYTQGDPGEVLALGSFTATL